MLYKKMFFVLFCFLRLLITAHGMKFTAQLYVFKDQLENMIKVTELTALYWSNDNNTLSLSLCFVFKSFFSLAYLSEFLFDVLSVAVFVIRDRFAKKSWHVLKSLSLCNKVLSILSLSLSLSHTHTYTHTHRPVSPVHSTKSKKKKGMLRGIRVMPLPFVCRFIQPDQTNSVL